MPTNDPRPTKAQRRDDARVQALKLREEQKKREKRNRFIAIGGLGAALAVLIFVVVTILSHASPTTSASDAAYTGDEQTLADVKTPSTAQENGGIPVAASGDAGSTAENGTVVDVYLDYMCPVCGQFEDGNGAQLAALRDEGDVTVVYHPISILDRLSNGTEYSTRAANAAAAVADLAPEKFVAFSDALFANQPEENTDGLSDEQIADIAKEVGVPDDVVAVFTETDGDNPWRVYAPYVSALTLQADEDLDKVQTPTILINGTPLDTKTYNWTIDGKLTEAVRAAQG
ncbi:DsbA family protein [Cellulomonas sp. P22]|uniref:DsbA family protein n=1 Tax=Cellulomonas sp. P22 TaxID=3373189 RepID=UPI0037ABFFBE